MGKPSIKPERCGHGQTQKSGAISDRATNHLDALFDGEYDQDRIIAYTDSDWAANREDRAFESGGMLIDNGGLLRFLVKKAEGGVALPSWGSELYAARINSIGGSRSPKWTQRLRAQHTQHTCDDRMRHPGSGGRSGTRVGETRAHQTPLAASSEG